MAHARRWRTVGFDTAYGWPAADMQFAMRSSTARSSSTAIAICVWGLAVTMLKTRMTSCAKRFAESGATLLEAGGEGWFSNVSGPGGLAAHAEPQDAKEDGQAKGKSETDTLEAHQASHRLGLLLLNVTGVEDAQKIRILTHRAPSHTFDSIVPSAAFVENEA